MGFPGTMNKWKKMTFVLLGLGYQLLISGFGSLSTNMAVNIILLIIHWHADGYEFSNVQICILILLEFFNSPFLFQQFQMIFQVEHQ